MSGGFIKMLKKEKSRKGFTLIEVLIVIAIIGILTAGMTLAAGGSRDAAEATRIIADLRTIKTAALMWMVDNPTTVTAGNWMALDGDPEPINRYLDRPLIANNHPFIFPVLELKDEEVVGEVWLLGYKLTGVRGGVKSKLADQASSAGLFKFDGISTSNKAERDGPLALKERDFYTSGEDCVFVIVQ